VRARTLLATIALAIIAMFSIAVMGLVAPVGAEPQVHTVLIEGMRFQPEGLTVAAGDTVVWINRDMVPHTATSASGRFDSNEIGPGKTWTYTARTGGEFDYICTYHPLMKAILRVK
jgi:plastocyanin